MMARYVILSESLFTENDWRRFGCGELQDKGYTIIPVQIGHAIGLPRPKPRGMFKSIDCAVDLKNLDDLDRLLRDIGTDDIVLVESRLSSLGRPLFRLLRRRGIRYVAVDLGNLPAYKLSSRHAALSLTEYLQIRVEDGFGWLHRLRTLVKEMVAHRFEYFRLQPPWLWLTAGTEVPLIGSGLPSFWKASRVPVASFDHLAAEKMRNRACQPDKTAVFLDEAFVDHPDFTILGSRSPVSLEYWSKLEVLFSAIEVGTGLRVVIAPHPKSTGLVPCAIRARMAEVGHTVELVRGSELVLCHASTAVSFAVLFRKPLMFITTDEIERSHYREAIARMSGNFASRRVNADRFASADLTIPHVDENLYQAYEHAFIRAPNAIDAWPWDVLHTLTAARNSQ
jgi:hypothetical protein